MTAPCQSIIVPIVGSVPHEAIAYAEMLSSAYSKPITILYNDKSLKGDLEVLGHFLVYSSLSLVDSINDCIKMQDSVMLVWGTMSSKRLLLSSLSSCRSLRIPYFYIPKGFVCRPPEHVVIPVTFLIEDREKGLWGRSLNRVFKSHISLVKPNDKGSRAAKNVVYISEFLSKNQISCRSVNSKKSSFKLSKDALCLFADDLDLLMLTASREYGLDDLFFGPVEYKIIKKSEVPVMVLNPRDDLYILCGD